jgi:hypothetical protein
MTVQEEKRVDHQRLENAMIDPIWEANVDSPGIRLISDEDGVQASEKEHAPVKSQRRNPGNREEWRGNSK